MMSSSDGVCKKRVLRNFYEVSLEASSATTSGENRDDM